MEIVPLASGIVIVLVVEAVIPEHSKANFLLLSPLSLILNVLSMKFPPGIDDADVSNVPFSSGKVNVRVVPVLIVPLSNRAILVASPASRIAKPLI